MTWIQTYTGKHFSIADLSAASVSYEDIEHALAHLCRFNGHTRSFYSVAQHSVLVSDLLETDEERMWGLVHDMAEAYTGDLARPFKGLPEIGPVWNAMEQKILRVIYEALGLPVEGPSPEVASRVLWADNVLLATECRDLMGGQVGGNWYLAEKPMDMRVIPLEPLEAKVLFAKAAQELLPNRP
jgi:uncharacterized protein